MRLILETGKPIVQVVARELGINEGTLGNWVLKERQQHEGGQQSLSANERGELNQLRNSSGT